VSRFVATAEIRLAVRGREGEVLDALAIDWRIGRPHIDCPYPMHGGKNDWRWDAQKSRAFCTCITRSDSIFDVVMKVKGLDFERAKISIAELLGRNDLIRERGGNRRQATDAASLLNAPAEDRDDTLPIAYLAHRLGVAPDAVPVPRTPIAGLKALGYYDPPPQGSKAKPKLVGEFPTAVFGTVAADGRTHAHRIYLAPRGVGKANLGTDPTGRARNPKKSARVIGNDNTAGRSVVWGDPAIAPHIILAEGIETGAAIALAMQAEITANEIAVAAAITAGGVEAFIPYPATARITIGTDRDEGEKDGKPGSRRGERAARACGIRHHEQLTIDIALPGAPGESVDWLDVLLRDRIDAVRAGLQRAAPFVPSQEELDAAARCQSCATELEETARQYPLPPMDTLTLRYAHTAKGQVKIHKVLETREGEVLIPVATPLGIPARLRFIDQGEAYGLRCVVQGMNRQPQIIDLERGALPRMAATEIRSRLFTAGLRTEADGEMVAVQILKAADPEREIIALRRPGWHEGHEVTGCPDPIFITPSSLVIGAPDGLDVELAMSAWIAPHVAESGTLDGWSNAIRSAVSVKKCPHWTIGAAGGFAGTIVDLTGLDSCGINFSGLSSTGKTLAQRLAVSAWSSPDIRRRGSLHQSAGTTEYFLEDLADRSKGTVLSLDELALVPGKIVGKMIYVLAGGVGRGRMAPDASARDRHSWQTFIMLSCECSLEEKIHSDGGQWHAGMAVRITDIDVTGVDRNVVQITLRAIDGIKRHYGHAGPAFVRALIERGYHRKAPELRERVLRAASELAGQGASGASIRAATPLAVLLVAGSLAKTFGLLPSETAITESIHWAWNRFSQSSDAAPLDPEKQAIDNILIWISERWEVTIKPVNTRSRNNREAVAWFDAKAVYITKGRLREAAGNTLKESQIAAILSQRGLLVEKPKPDRYCVEWIPKIGRIPAYALSRDFFGRQEQMPKPDNRGPGHPPHRASGR
jgi:phage/plasmid primase-like uncharacterized protein